MAVENHRHFYWRPRGDSNAEPFAPQADALSIELRGPVTHVNILLIRRIVKTLVFRILMVFVGCSPHKHRPRLAFGGVDLDADGQEQGDQGGLGEQVKGDARGAVA